MKQASESSITRISRLREALPCALAELAVMAFEGPDAIAFAQAQLASDVAALAPGQWQWSCLLSAQGRVLAFGPLLRAAPDSLAWVVPAAGAQAISRTLQRFVLRRKLVITTPPTRIEGHAGGAESTPPRTGGPIATTDDGWTIDLGGCAGRRLRLVRAPSPVPPSVAAAGAAWLALDAVDALPFLLGEAIDAHTAHALGLQRVDAFSTRKGCYPGQEIVARTHFLGRNKRGPRVGWLPPGTPAPLPGSRWLDVGAAADAEALAETVHAAATDAGTVVLVVARDDAPPQLRFAPAGATAAFESVHPAGADAAKML